MSGAQLIQAIESLGGINPEHWTMPATCAARANPTDSHALLLRGDQLLAASSKTDDGAHLIAVHPEQQNLSVIDFAALLEVQGRDGGMVLDRCHESTGREAFALLGGGALREVIPLRLYRHTNAEQHRGAETQTRPARANECELLATWATAFAEHTAMPGPTDSIAFMQRAIESGGVRVLEHNDSVVAMGQLGMHPAAGQSRIGLIFVPRQHRRRGYAKRLVASLTAEVHRLPAVPCLFTDAANHGTDQLYREVGYEPVGEQVHLEPVYAAEP